MPLSYLVYLLHHVSPVRGLPPLELGTKQRRLRSGLHVSYSEAALKVPLLTRTGWNQPTYIFSSFIAKEEALRRLPGGKSGPLPQHDFSGRH